MRLDHRLPDIESLFAGLEEDPTDPRFRMVDQIAAESETLQFLFSVVRRLKPQICIETGTYTGISSCVIAEALKRNGTGGKLWTMDLIDHEDLLPTLTHFGFGPPSPYLEFMQGDSLDPDLSLPDPPYDFVFVDSANDFEIVLGELRRYAGELRPGGIALVHDGFHGTPKMACDTFHVESGFSRIRFSSARNLDIFQRVEP